MTTDDAITALEALGFQTARLMPFGNGVFIPVTRAGAVRDGKRLYAGLTLLDGDDDNRVHGRIDNLVRTFNNTLEAA